MVGIGSNLWSWQRAQRDRQRQHRARHCVDLVVDVVHDEAHLEALIDVFDAERQKPCRRQKAIAFGRRIRWQQVAGDLLLDEAIERHVGVHRVDHVIAIFPGIGIGDVPRWAGRFAVPGHVEPVPTPAFAELRRSEQAINDLLVGQVSNLSDKVVDLFRRRRQTGEVKRQSPKQSQAIGVADRFQLHAFELGEDKAVDIVARPGGILDGGHFRIGQRLPGPMFGPELSIFGFRLAERRWHSHCRPGGAALDPRRQVGNFFGRQRLVAFGRHPPLDVLERHALQQQALRRVAGHDGRAVVAAVEQAVAVVDAQAALGVCVGRVADVAMIDEDRPDLFLEEVDCGIIGRRPAESSGWDEEGNTRQGAVGSNTLHHRNSMGRPAGNQARFEITRNSRRVKVKSPSAAEVRESLLRRRSVAY